MFGLGCGWRVGLSKVRRRRASRASRGVLPGVFGHVPCAGLGVMLTKSAKLNAVDGVVGAKPGKYWSPGVDIIEDGRGVCFDGGVEGGYISVLDMRIAGEGDAAR